MPLTMDKEILIRVPSSLYRRVKKLCQKDYRSISSLVRELLFEEMEETLTEEDIRILEKQSLAFHRGEGIDWRKVRRG